jgi:hypothetical protein
MSQGENATPTPKAALRRTLPFPPRRDYSSLSVRDLVEAREAYHVHLSSLENVVGTAIGRYLIHERDWYANNPPDTRRPRDWPRITSPRMLSNTVVRSWSWPSVLVFVRRWEDVRALGRDAVPRTLYLPDGRVVPTCVVLATHDEALPPPVMSASPAGPLLGGGYACLRRHQGTASVGTVACLVRKDGAYYALTNRHVAGGDAEEVQALLRGQYERIGEASPHSVGRLLMSSIFQSWSTGRTYLRLDAGLIRIDDLEDWTSQVFGIGEVGELFDATEQSISLDLIGLPVRGFGGSSGVMEGQIQALFFRYQSLGGDDHATDLLIGPRRHETHGTELTPLTLPGDSGTLWFYDPPDKAGAEEPREELGQGPVKPERGLRARRLRPLAMQWGGERIKQPDGSTSAFALGAFLSSVCRALDVEVMRSWSIGHDEYWGKIGHFAIGWKACDQVHGALGTLMKRNQVRIGFGNDRLEEGSEFRMGRGAFVPLSDVPDYVWIMARKNEHEGIQHFADIDIHDIDGAPSLLDQCVVDPRKVAASAWKAYFDGFAGAEVGPEEGCLPFRVWQIWEEMVRFLQAGDVLRFVAAAGVLAHYVGDASQPLHGSYLHHGVPPMVTREGREYPVPRDDPRFQEFKETRAAKIHAIYEQTMLEVDPATALAAVDQDLANRPASTLAIARGHDAAVATVQVIHDARTRLSPTAIIEADDPALGPKARAAALWADQAIRDATVVSLADSVALLARLWETAWAAGGGASIPTAALVQFGEPELETVYRDHQFLRALDLGGMVQSGRFEPPA